MRGIKMKVDVIIPTYKPDKGFPEMIKRLEKQTLKPNRIIIMNTEEKYFEKLLYGTDFAMGASGSRGASSFQKRIQPWRNQTFGSPPQQRGYFCLHDTGCTGRPTTGCWKSLPRLFYQMTGAVSYGQTAAGEGQR